MSGLVDSEGASAPVAAVAAPLAWSVAARRRALAVAVALGVAASGFYLVWWIDHGAAYGVWIVPAFLFVAFYVVVQIYCAWFLYLSIDVPGRPSAPPGLTVDVFVPVYDESYDLVERSLTAAVAMSYPHRTHLLDDARNAAFATLAARLGAGYLTRSGHDGAKAGNVNAALARTDADFVTVFDVDHVPEPEFLDVALGHFRDPAVGFVQSGVGFRNRGESFVAQATSDQAHDIYGPTSMGMHGAGAAVVWGSHTTFRRSALDRIGGYQTGLAEDLHTSMRLHAAGWRSVYVPTVHAWGLVPGDLIAFTRQQLKWARGVFAMLVEVFPRLSRRLAPGQWAAYLVRLTYYLIGPLFVLHVLAGLGVLVARDPSVRADFASYLLHAAPLVGAIVVVRQLANRFWNPLPGSGRLNVWGYAQAFAFWPVYTLALACALLRVPIPHLSTPKERTTERHPRLALPQVVVLTLLLGGVVWRLAHGVVAADVLVIGFAAAAAGVQATAVYAALRP